MVFGSRWCVRCRGVVPQPHECEPAEPAEPAEPTGGVVAVYADGGCVGRNPSADGGTWAWCHVNAADARVAFGSGVVTPAEVGVTNGVSNNVSEVMALLMGLAAVPDGWAGDVFTDSSVARSRFARPKSGRMTGVPDGLAAQVRASLARLGACRFHLLGGHPTRDELAAGRRKRNGLPVSVHNVWCDRACNEQAAAFRLAARAGVTT